MHIRLNAELASDMRRYVRRRGDTLTAVVERHFRDLLRRERAAERKTAQEVEQI